MITLKSINQNEAIRYMGYGNNKPNEQMQTMIDACEQKLLEVIVPRYLYNCYDISLSDGIVTVANSSLELRGKDIYNHLKGCTKAIFMCATLSGEVDALIRKAQITDITKALIIDSLASAGIESVCNQIDELIVSEYPDYYTTWRFSPGYGDFPISIQRSFLDILNAPKRIGLTVNSGNILIPTKSVTAIIGLSPTPLKRNKKGCAGCNMAQTCEYRKRGDRCEF